MDFSSDSLKSLIRNPTESLGVEVKRWLNPLEPVHKAKIVKACLALRNNNGGCLVIGFCDDGSPDPNILSDVRQVYHVDSIQELVAKHSSHPFEISVEFVERDQVEYPVICIPSGVETPVAVKSQLQDASGTLLINDDEVYVRSLHSNNRVSSTRARAGDWDRLVKICFDNREANIGAFIRRHLSGINAEQLIGAFRNVEPSLSPVERVHQLLQEGRERFQTLQADREHPHSDAGLRDVAAVVIGNVSQFPADEDFLNRLLLTMPRYTGWSPWVDCRNAAEECLRPYVYDNGWEAYLLTEWSGIGLDFWRIEPSGRFYHIRAIEDDMPRRQSKKPEPRTELDFMLQTSRTAESMASVLSFARTMGCDEQTTSVAFAFGWSGLKYRHLSSWVEPMRRFYSRGPSHQDSITAPVLVPLETPDSGLATHVEAAVAPLFRLFGGMTFESSVIEDIVSRTLGRRS